MVEQPDFIAPLKDLYDLIGASVKGYQNAAGEVDYGHLVTFFSNRAVEHYKLQQELALAVHNQFPKEQKLEESAVNSELHHAWLEMHKSATGDLHPLDACDRCEAYLLQHYVLVLENEALPAVLRDLLRDQEAKVIITRFLIKHMRSTGEHIDD
ncbi:MAG: PA2169 family four-helix-bundle protein [Flavobacteriales bacterium]